VLADDAGQHEPMPGYETINYFAADRDLTEDMEVIDQWQPSEEVRSGGYTVDDFNFTTPKADLSNIRSQPLANDHADFGMYEWLGDYPAAGDGEHYARVRLEESQALAQRSLGHATVRGMAPGRTFTMQNSPRVDDNREYLIVSASYALREGGYASGSEPGEYGFSFTVQPTSLAFRAPSRTSVPRTSGPQTATVVGPEGKEIWTDRYGRVKVQFHWDRYGQHNENSSRFVRVSQVNAGDGYGTVFTPRIGQEVVVDFISGRPDRPIIVGRVYNADQMPPLNLPGEATQSGFVTRSTPGGSPATANSLIFEDKMGAEEVALHAERELNLTAEVDMHINAGRDIYLTADNIYQTKRVSRLTKTPVNVAVTGLDLSWKDMNVSATGIAVTSIEVNITATPLIMSTTGHAISRTLSEVKSVDSLKLDLGGLWTSFKKLTVLG
jgi:type VI secretion system secreted protein VgrG